MEIAYFFANSRREILLKAMVQPLGTSNNKK
jgi:hypothetical protein